MQLGGCRLVRAAGKVKVGRRIAFAVAVAAIALAVGLPLCGAVPSLSSGPTGSLPDRATLVFVGDLMLGRGVTDLMEERSSDWLFAEVQSLLQVDLVVANLESPLADLPGGAPRALNLAAGPGAIEALSSSANWAVSVANNHAFDAGAEGLDATLSSLARRGITAVGAGETLAEARRARILNLNGIRVALLAYCDVPQATSARVGGGPVVAEVDLDAMETEIRETQQQADVVIVLFHWGQEYECSPTLRQRDVAERARRAGADVVVGAHPHVAQPVEFQPGSIVAYSLGNFVFDQWRSVETTRGQALRVQVSRSGLEQVEVVPLSLADGRPAIIGEPAREPNANVAFCWNGRGFESRLANWFYEAAAPEADLDGDGSPERAVIEHGRLRVLDYVDGEWGDVWSTPDDWQVERVALGDVNHDGRPEVVFSLWRTYLGRFGNQPFVFGFRDGQYRPVWRGSAVADPIRELAVGDVDGDGQSELVVLEGDPTEDRGQPPVAVTVWRWSGWGFYLDWRSPLARYHSLRLVDVIGDGGLDILLVRN